MTFFRCRRIIESSLVRGGPMAKVQVTSQLAELIRSIRLQNGIKSVSLAEHIGKSAAYVSKLEKGDIQTLEKECLHKILNFITQGKDSFDDVIEEVYATLKFKYSQKEISQQLWFDNFDTVERLIPIPFELSSDLSSIMNSCNINIPYLCERINSNESIPIDISKNSQYPINEWFIVSDTAPNDRYIIIKMTEIEISDILNGEKTETPYIFLLALTFYLLKISKCGNTIEISEEESLSLMEESTSFLSKYKVYTLAERDKLMTGIISQNDLSNVLSKFDLENQDIVTQILIKYRVWSDRDIKSANRLLENYLKNLTWDIGFVMKLTSYDYFSLDKISYTSKKKLLQEMLELIGRYKSMEDEDMLLEEY